MYNLLYWHSSNVMSTSVTQEAVGLTVSHWSVKTALYVLVCVVSAQAYPFTAARLRLDYGFINEEVYSSRHSLMSSSSLFVSTTTVPLIYTAFIN